MTTTEDITTTATLTWVQADRGWLCVQHPIRIYHRATSKAWRVMTPYLVANRYQWTDVHRGGVPLSAPTAAEAALAVEGALDLVLRQGTATWMHLDDMDGLRGVDEVPSAELDDQDESTVLIKPQLVEALIRRCEDDGVLVTWDRARDALLWATGARNAVGQIAPLTQVRLADSGGVETYLLRNALTVWDGRNDA